MAGAMGFLLLGGLLMSQLKTQFFPKDLFYLSYVDIWLPDDAPLSATNDAAAQSEAIIREIIREYARITLMTTATRAMFCNRSRPLSAAVDHRSGFQLYLRFSS